MKLSILMPVFNEANTVVAIVECVRTGLQAATGEAIVCKTPMRILNFILASYSITRQAFYQLDERAKP